MNTYLQRHGWPGPEIMEPAIPGLAVSIVIPAFNEENLIPLLNDLRECDPTVGGVEILIVINHPENSVPEVIAVNEHAFKAISEWIVEHQESHRRYHVIYKPDLPPKKAGVGLARKIGMDEAVRRFEHLNNPAGIIVCLDADCRIRKNYLSEIEHFFLRHPKCEGCSIYFEHTLDDLGFAHRNAIIDYELHLRYFIGIQRWAGFPFAFQTIGSAMAVRSDVYCKVGGMNTRKAGEDFYFLQKVIERGVFRELNSTTVFPSARTSGRVPFGTGRAMLNHLSGNRLSTYKPEIFHGLKVLLQTIPLFQQSASANTRFLLFHYFPPPLRTFLLHNGIYYKLDEFRTHTSTIASFRKRFLRWFNAFMLMKYVHAARDGFYDNIPVGTAVVGLARMTGAFEPEGLTNEALLLRLREYDRTFAFNEAPAGSPDG